MNGKHVIIAAAVIALGLAVHGLFPRYEIKTIGKGYAYRVDGWTGATSFCGPTTEELKLSYDAKTKTILRPKGGQLVPYMSLKGGQWLPKTGTDPASRLAANPDTGEVVELVENKWVPGTISGEQKTKCYDEAK